ncbi:uncharacterized protein [Ciconia boyciana]|uniref:uncharacterized protein n=1 Tax=Ciconia boyciana TaxID=52775 RepID=UPI003B9E14AD
MEGGLRLLALGALLMAGPCGGAPTPGIAPRCPQAAPPPPPTPPPLLPDCVPGAGDTHSPGDDVTAQGTNRPGATGATSRRVPEVTRDATAVVGPIATSQGGDKVVVATHGDVIMEGTEEPGVTQDPGDAVGHVTEVTRDATTVVGPIATSQGDNLMVATHGDVTMEGTEEPDVTNQPGDTLGHVTMVYREATTVVGPIATSQGGDNLMVATHGDVLMEGTERPGVTNCSGDTLGHVAEVLSGDTTTEGPVTASQGGDKLMVATHGDVTMEGTEEPGVTRDPGDTLSHVAEVSRDATTMVGPIATSQGGDNLMVATHGDVLVEGTAQPGVTQDPGDTLGHVAEVSRDATTVVGPIATSQGGDRVLVATHGDVTMEGTEEPDVTNQPGDALGHVAEVLNGDTTTEGPVTTSQGGDNLMVATHGDVILEGTKDPCVTGGPGDAVGHVTVGYRGDTTTAGRATTSQGGDQDVVAREGGVLMEGTARPDVTDQPGDTLDHVTVGYAGDVTAAGPVTASQGGDEAAVAQDGDVLMEGTEEPGVTQDPGDTLGHVTEVSRDATTVVGPIATSQGDYLMVATHGDVLVEGTAQPGVTQDPGDTLGHVAEVSRDATTVVGPIATSQGGDRVLVATHGDVTMEGTEEPDVTNQPGDALGHVAEVLNGDTTTEGPVTTSQGGDNLMVATHGDVLMEGTERPGVTNCSGDTLSHVAEVSRDATTVVGPIATSQGGDNLMVATHGDVTMEGTEEPSVTQDPGDAVGHVTEVYREATTVVGPIATSQGGDNLMVATHGDVIMEGTARPGVTQDPGDTLGHVTEVSRDATAVVGPITMSQGGDKVVVATHGDVLMEGTEEPGVTQSPGDAVGHVTMVYREATTVVGPIATSQGGDKLMVATHGDVTMEGTEEPGVTQDPGDAVGHVTEVSRDVTTVVGAIATSQGGDKVVVATHGDVLMEGTEEPDVTNQPGDTLGHVTMVYREATTVVGPIAMSQGGDKVVVATHGDVIMEGTAQPSVTQDPGDAVGHVTEVSRDVTTVVGPIATSHGGDNLMVATHGDVIMEGTEEPDVTNQPGDALGHVTEVLSGDTTMEGPVTTSQGGDNLMVATHGDVTMEGTEEPGVTRDPGDTLSHVTEVSRDATTMVGPIATSEGDKLMVATHGDVTMEGTEEPDVTNQPGDTLGHVAEVLNGDTTTEGPVTTSQGGDNLMVATHGDVTMEGTEEPGVTQDPGDTLGHVTEVSRDATTVVGPIATSQGDNLMVATHGDVLVEGTAQPGVTQDPGDAVGHVTEVSRDVTTVVGPIATSHGGDKLMVATHGDVTMEGTEELDVTRDPGDTLGHVTEGYRDATAVVGPSATSQGGDNLMVATHGDVLMEGTERPGVTNCSGDTLGHVAEVSRDATTMVGPIATSQGGDRVLVATHGDVTMEGTEEPGVTQSPGDTLGHVTMVYREATTVVGPIATSQGGDNLMVATHGDVIMEGTARPGVTQDPGDTLGHVTEASRDATTVVGPIPTSQGGDRLLVATRPPPPRCHPPPPPATFPVTLAPAPGGPHGLSGASPPHAPPLLLLLLPLPSSSTEDPGGRATQTSGTPPPSSPP